MPRKRQPKEVWRITRAKVWLRDSGICAHCGKPQKLEECHVDHIVSGKNGTNHLDNLRILCPICHALRADMRHKGMRDKMLAKGLLPPNWRELIWD